MTRERIATAIFSFEHIHVALGVSARGICYLTLSEDRLTPMEKLAAEFPGAALVEDEAATKDAIAAVRQWFATGKYDYPLDLRGTAFQLQIWEQLAMIPYGQTISYGELARRAGNRHAMRAAGSACGANPVALLIPCHRVLASGGKIGGFGCGLGIKKWLLARETAVPQACEAGKRAA